MASLRLHVPRAIEREFKRLAKAAWPKETYALLLGTQAGDRVDVDALHVPDDVLQFTGPKVVYIQPHWIQDAKESADEDGLIILGDAHSHPFRYAETGGAIFDRVQSEQDHDCPIRWLIHGVCNVQEQKSGSLRASLRFWGPTITVDLIHE